MQIMENKAMRKLAKGRSEEILLIEHRRAHNICIELAGVRMPFPAIKVLHRTRCMDILHSPVEGISAWEPLHSIAVS